MRDFRKYEIWNVGMEVVSSTYSILESLPDYEKFGLRSQISRSAVSIPSNIAEGCSRASEKDFKRFLEYSLGSSFELETQLLICKRNNFVENTSVDKVINNIHRLQKQLTVLIEKLK